MTKKNIPRPTESELEILQVLWQQGPSTVRFVNDELSKRRDVGYTTTLKLLQLMHEKGIVTRDDSSRTHVYRAALREQETQGMLIDRLLDAAFGGSALKLVQQALGNRQTSREELDQIRNLLDSIDNQNPTTDPDELA
ncbi:BlaI/MecI/CopY family transcriptional regulator [Solirubrum puertoriconensis]|uniref:Transcriptional regulator n=1 Tax=Solirubrum puertoriconensis TaxID=1751427 RepID=A0A9X0HIX4_SOLP1|nr:BlaI/MecI/CopY family transcriptional regulator [Solirubrum puertoriconensis]KUG06723.1 transcriptional regulator [Solirubrum puertoriconensis]